MPAPAGMELAADTSLELFGHKVEAWYNAKDTATAKQTYAVLDRATLSATVYAGDAVLSVATPDGTNDLLGLAAKKAGFSVEVDAAKSNATKAFTSDEYSRISAERAANATATASEVNMYALVSNSSNKGVDVVISLNADVAQIYTKDTTATDKSLTLGSATANTSDFGADQDGKILLDELVPGSVETLGEIVTAWEIKGTVEAAPTDGDFMYRLDAFTDKDKVTGTIDTYKSADATATTEVTQVTLTDGTVMELSGITEEDHLISACLTELLNSNTAAGITYTFYKDVLGRFIGAEIPVTNDFLYATYGDFEAGALGSGSLTYHVTGVNWNGEIVKNHILTNLNDETVDGTVYGTYSKFPVAHKDFGATGSVGNEIVPGINTGYQITEQGVAVNTNAHAMADTATWTMTSADAARGFLEVTNGAETYLLTNNTKFIVVSGNGLSNLKVTPYTGMSGLVGTGSSAVISKVAAAAAVADGITGDMNNVYFQTTADRFGTVNTENNRTIETVIL